MSIFSAKKNKAEEVVKADKPVKAVKAVKTAKAVKAVSTEVKTKSASTSTETVFDNRQVIIRPRITEKASLLASNNVYTFEVAKNATKNMVFKAVKDIYKVTPVKVSVAQNPSKKVFARGKMGRSGGVKKAYVYLRKGDKIEII